MGLPNPFQTLKRYTEEGRTVYYYSLPALQEAGVGTVTRLPYSLRVLLENLMRHADEEIATEAQVRELCNWSPRQ